MRLSFVVPAGFDDPDRPSGGNVYDRRVAAALAALGWDVRLVPVPGAWPGPDAAAQAAVARALNGMPDAGLVLVDGLIASGSAAVLVGQASRLRMGILVHTLFAGSGLANVPAGIGASEAAVLGAATVVITTSAWTREQLLARHPVPAARVRVVPPGVDPAPVSPGTAGGGALLCVANVVAHKGHDLLVAALAQLRDEDWCCTCVGALDQDRDFVARVRAQAAAAGVSDRIRLVGVLDEVALQRAYADADLVIVASRVESYGLVVTEALAHGLPVFAANVGGIPEALGRTGPWQLPGVLVAPDDPDALAAAVRAWLRDPGGRATLREAAHQRRATLRGWDGAARDLAAALTA